MKLEANLISGRTAYQGSFLEAKTYKRYMEECAVCELNSEDLSKLGVSKGDSLKVSTEFGEVVVAARPNDGNPGGLAFIPMGPWANAILDPDTHGCGMPGLKGVPAQIEPTDQEPLDMKTLMRTYYTQGEKVL